jgi:hypothetical protein
MTSNFNEGRTVQKTTERLSRNDAINLYRSNELLGLGEAARALTTQIFV